MNKMIKNKFKINNSTKRILRIKDKVRIFNNFKFKVKQNKTTF